MKAVLHVLGCGALLAFCWLMTESALTIRYARQRSVYTFDQLNKVLRETSQTLDEVRKGATVWREASKSQAEATSASLKKTSLVLSDVDAAAKRFTTLISSTDDSVNSRLIPALTTSIEQQNAALLGTEQSLQQNLIQSQKVLADADERISDPSIKIALDSLATTSQNAAESTKQVQLALTDVRQMADKARETYLKPVNLWWGLVKELLPLAGSAAQVIK